MSAAAAARPRRTVVVEGLGAPPEPLKVEHGINLTGAPADEPEPAAAGPVEPEPATEPVAGGDQLLVPGAPAAAAESAAEAAGVAVPQQQSGPGLLASPGQAGALAAMVQEFMTGADPAGAPVPEIPAMPAQGQDIPPMLYDLAVQAGNAFAAADRRRTARWTKWVTVVATLRAAGIAEPALWRLASRIGVPIPDVPAAAAAIAPAVPSAPAAATAGAIPAAPA